MLTSVDFLQMVCALILWRSGLGLLMGKFSQILPCLTELSARDKIMGRWGAGYYSLTFLFVIDIGNIQILIFKPNLVQYSIFIYALDVICLARPYIPVYHSFYFIILYACTKHV